MIIAWNHVLKGRFHPERNLLIKMNGDKVGTKTHLFNGSPDKHSRVEIDRKAEHGGWPSLLV